MIDYSKDTLDSSTDNILTTQFTPEDDACGPGFCGSTSGRKKQNRI